MKETITFLLALVMMLSLAACGGGSTTTNTPAPTEAPETPTPTAYPTPEPTEEPTPEPIVTYSLGETVSTDIVDFTLEEAQLSFYADRNATPLNEPNDDKYNPYHPAKIGQCLVCITFRIKNNNRTDMALSSSSKGSTSWKWNFEVNYNDNTYHVSGNQNEDFFINLGVTKVSTNDGQSFNQGIDGAMISAGDEWIIKAVGYIGVEPDSLNDSFELTINIPNSSSNDEYFKYSIN